MCSGENSEELPGDVTFQAPHDPYLFDGWPETYGFVGCELPWGSGYGWHDVACLDG